MADRQFNPQQQTVIEAQDGYHLVLAPPGCGKTAVLAERIVWAHSQGMPFADMACLTFTNRAARGMRERIADRLGNTEDIDELFVGNVHRFCSRFLFDNGIVPEHSAVIDTDTSISIIAELLGEDELRVLGDASQRQRYSQIVNLQHLLYQCEKGHPGALMVHRDNLPAHVLKELCTTFRLDYTQQATIDFYRHADFYLDQPVILSSEAVQLLRQLFAAHSYARYKQRNDLLDFEDLLLFTFDAITTGGVTFKPLRWLQIDEVQDLNPLQLAIVDQLTAPLDSQPTVVYLGDAQQAIFSFMGARTDTLAKLYRRCGEGHFHNFFVNYRSPRYLLDVYNTYGERQLGIAAHLLPSTDDTRQAASGDLVLMEAATSTDEANMVADEVRRIYEQCADETVAVVVAFNSDADEVSAALGRLPHFKVSGTDVFTTPTVRVLLAHLSVVSMEHNFLTWSELFTGLHIYSSSSSSRQFVRSMTELAMTPVDFLDYGGRSTYLAEFVSQYEERDIVVFDTETTGLDVFNDDVVQLAAVKLRRGRVVDELNLFIETERTLPPMLGDVANPLVEEYARQPHLSHQEALQQFVTFAAGCAVAGHNTTFDFQVMEHNMRRYAPQLSMYRLCPDYLDTLKMAHLLHPRQHSYKLKNLLTQLGLEGTNSHLANDDILATQSLLVYCYDRARSIVGRQMQFASRHRKVIDRFCHVYGDLYQHARQRLFNVADGPLLADELRYAYDLLKREVRLEQQPKLRYILRYIECDLLTPSSGHSLWEQLNHHIQDLCTMKEADLCGSASMDERVFVSTVHKAKGLEFDHVIVYDAVEGKFPSAFANSRANGGEEEARKFYVAISRARRRLIISYCHESVSRWGRTYRRTLSPYVNVIRQFFSER
ncbi:MAG: UvrD-helicase domain-containing protein [Prevotella sp.]|nr:UvrD-helicase domain-containing protein [Prevotella sp.]